MGSANMPKDSNKNMFSKMFSERGYAHDLEYKVTVKVYAQIQVRS